MISITIAFVVGVLVGAPIVNYLYANLSKTIEVVTGIQIEVDGKKFIPKDVNGKEVESFVYGGTTYVPIRAISSIYGSHIEWNGESRTVFLNTKKELETENAKPSSSKDLTPENLNKLEKIIYEDCMKDMDADLKDKKLFPVITFETIETKEENDFTKVFLIIREELFSFDGIKFKEESGSIIPFRYDIDEDGKIIKKWPPEDGELYGESILEMAENDKNLAKKLIEHNSYGNSAHQRRMNELLRVALKMGLKKEDISFELKEIPKYNKNVVYIEENIPEGNVCVIHEKEYQDLQEERKQIVPDTQAGKHWVYRHCIWWNEETGLCLEKIIDYQN